MPRLDSQICSLPTEILYTILRAVLDEIVEHDMIFPKPEHRMPGGQSFPHTMALVCRHWRDVVFSAPVLWTRIFCTLPEPSAERILSYQLEKTGIHPVDLTIVSNPLYYTPDTILHCVEPHVGRLRSLRISNLLSVDYDIITLPVYAPWLECLQLEYTRQVQINRLKKLFEINCPILRILGINRTVAKAIGPQWCKNNLTRVEFVTISLGSSYEDNNLQVLSSIPRRIPSLTIECLDSPYIYWDDLAIKIGVEEVILHGRAAHLGAIDDHWKTIVLRKCNIDSKIHILPSSCTLLELDRCFASKVNGKFTRKWDGDTVIITNSNYFCIQTVLTCLNAPQGSLNNSGELGPWSRVTTLKLVAKNKFKMKFSVSLLRDVVDRRSTWNDALQKNAEKDEKLGDGEFEGVEPIRVLHVHGGPPLSRHMRSWFKKRIEDFVWDYKRS